MTRMHRLARIAATLVLVAVACALGAAQAAPDVETVVARVRQRVAEYYHRAQSLICVERSTVQPIEWNWMPTGMSRTVESELRVESDAVDGDTLPEPTVVRNVRRINGRAPRERDRTDRSGCTDPAPISPDPLGFLLGAHRDEYRFTAVRNVTDKGRAALAIDFVSKAAKSNLELIEDKSGHADCFDWTGPVVMRGRIWVDANTYDVLRVEQRIAGPTNVRVPEKLQRRYAFEQWVVIDRNDVDLRYKPITFTDPDETLLLPESMDSLVVLRGGLQSIRRTDTFDGYRRFLTQTRIVKVP